MQIQVHSLVLADHFFDHFVVDSLEITGDLLLLGHNLLGILSPDLTETLAETVPHAQPGEFLLEQRGLGREESNSVQNEFEDGLNRARVSFLLWLRVGIRHSLGQFSECLGTLGLLLLVEDLKQTDGLGLVTEQRDGHAAARTGEQTEGQLLHYHYLVCGEEYITGTCLNAVFVRRQADCSGQAEILVLLCTTISSSFFEVGFQLLV